MHAQIRGVGQVEVISFDCYGTLVDWESGILGALQAVLAAHGAFPPPVRILERYAVHEAAVERGPYRSYRDVLREVVAGFGADYGFRPAPDELECLAASVPGWKPFDDTPTALASLGKVVRLAVLSNVDDDLFEPTSALLGVKFDCVVTAQQVRSYKPAAANFQALRDRLGVPPERILHAAQSIYHDIVPAARAGFRTAWVNRISHRPGRGATPEASASADLAVSDLASLVDRLGG